MTRIRDYFCSEPMVQQLNALACEIEENMGSVSEVSSKLAEPIRSPLLEKMQKKKGKQKSTFFDNECERKKEELNHMLEYAKKSRKGNSRKWSCSDSIEVKEKSIN